MSMLFRRERLKGAVLFPMKYFLKILRIIVLVGLGLCCLLTVGSTWLSIGPFHKNHALYDRYSQAIGEIRTPNDVVCCNYDGDNKKKLMEIVEGFVDAAKMQGTEIEEQTGIREEYNRLENGYRQLTEREEKGMLSQNSLFSWTMTFQRFKEKVVKYINSQLSEQRLNINDLTKGNLNNGEKIQNNHWKFFFISPIDDLQEWLGIKNLLLQIVFKTFIITLLFHLLSVDIESEGQMLMKRLQKGEIDIEQYSKQISKLNLKGSYNSLIGILLEGIIPVAIGFFGNNLQFGKIMNFWGILPIAGIGLLRFIGDKLLGGGQTQPNDIRFIQRHIKANKVGILIQIGGVFLTASFPGILYFVLPSVFLFITRFASFTICGVGYHFYLTRQFFELNIKIVKDSIRGVNNKKNTSKEIDDKIDGVKFLGKQK